MSSERYDVLIIGGGLAGLTLARQLLLGSDKRILLVDRRSLPPRRQKVGEATVQVSAYYLSRVLELEEHLLRRHFVKYNLRFFWRGGEDGSRYEGYSQSYIRTLSNIMTYQLDRNALEAELLRVNRENPRFTFHAPISGLDIELGEGELPHAFRFRTGGEEGRGREEVAGAAEWMIDTSGRGKVLAKRLGLADKGVIRHGTAYAWVEGLVDVEKLTDLSAREIRLRPDRAAVGHLPAFLATNHFCGEGYWFWVIPLHGRTSLGLVYDSSRVSSREVATPEKLIEWVCERFPLFARDLPRRRVVDHGGFTDFSYDCKLTFSPGRWALCGEAGRFSDPLYSPGGDLIAIHNTLVTDLVVSGLLGERLAAKTALYEQLARAVYEAYVPSYALSYDTLGDQEAFSLRYTWELTVYFAFYVFPFINDLFTVEGFAAGFLRRFARLGRINHGLHALLQGYYRWKKERRSEAGAAAALEPARVAAVAGSTPTLFDFTEIGHLKQAEACFYRVGVGREEGLRQLDRQLVNLDELARFIAAQVSWGVTGDARAWSHDFVSGIDPRRLRFDPREMAARLAACAAAGPAFAWSVAVPVPGRLCP
ncbi:MAG: tryptophan 7-halogenase, partial [Acidobacteriota bacterium]|nr:tryptophan 7-halogenase [Acidobacteriota bacterium]